MWNFVKNTYEENKEQPAIPLELLFEKFKVIELTPDEVECYLSSLIYKGYIKGLIIHQKQIALSKQNPFPELKQVVKENKI